MDLKLTPLRVTLFGEIIFQIRIKIGFVRVTIRKVFFRRKLWEYRTKTIHKRIFGDEELEPDLTPPEYVPFQHNPVSSSISLHSLFEHNFNKC